VLGQGLQLGGLLLDLADQPGHARHHQQDRRDRADPDGGRVDPAAPPRLAEQQDRRDQRDPGQQREPPACEPPRPLQGRLGQLRHRRVQRRRPEQHIGQQPGEVDGVVGSERIGLGAHGEAHVTGQHDHQGAGQELEGGIPHPGADQQPGHQGQQQHVGRRVGDGDEPADTTVRVLSVAAGFIRNTHDSRPRPLAMMVASVRLARSRPGFRARISSAIPAASSHQVSRAPGRLACIPSRIAATADSPKRSYQAVYHHDWGMIRIGSVAGAPPAGTAANSAHSYLLLSASHPWG
jgi:hypothetical protein